MRRENQKSRNVILFENGVDTDWAPVKELPRILINTILY